MKFMTMNEVAETLSVSRMTIHRLVGKGEIKSLKIGRAVRIPEESLKEYVDRNLKGNGGEHPQGKLSESEFSLEGMFTEGEPIPKLERSYKDAWERQRNLMEQGFHMGQRQRIKRDDLYERD